MVDHAAAVAQLRWPVLPEIIPHSGPAAAMIAQKDGSGQMFRARQKRRKPAGFDLGAFAQGGGLDHAAA
jgi:hypothetical protein